MVDKIDINIATLWRQGHVVKTINSLRNQSEFGTANIICNNWTAEQEQFIVKELGDDKRIKMYKGNNAKESNEKLRYVGVGTNKYCGFFDDDIIYSEDYLAYLIAGVEKYQAYVSLHGVVFNDVVNSYYRDRTVYRGLKTVENDVCVDVASNCGSVFRRDFFDNYQKWYTFAGNVGMDDLYCAYFCMQKRIPRMVLKHNENYIKHKEQFPEDNYVFNKYALTGNDKVQTDFVNNFIKKINK